MKEREREKERKIIPRFVASLCNFVSHYIWSLHCTHTLRKEEKKDDENEILIEQISGIMMIANYRSSFLYLSFPFFCYAQNQHFFISLILFSNNHKAITNIFR